MSGHTQGKWTLEPASMGFGGLYGPDGKIIFALAYARSDERPEAECQANARLIAAAPEMLEALKDATELLAEWRPRLSGAQRADVQLAKEHLSSLIEKCRAAIAKAEGRQP